MLNKTELIQWIEEHAEPYNVLAQRIWENPEIAYREFQASQWQAELLAREGFKITWDLAGMNTAFMAEWGEDGLLLGFAGEYDALPGLSQKNVPYKEAHEPGGAGHACGHNLLGAGTMLAAVAVKHWLEESGKKGRLRYYGCPAEESGSGKTFMARAGLFDDLDAALNYHPMMMNYASKGSVIGAADILFRFHGRTAHAGAAPHLGRSALDAVELMNVGVNYLREHVPGEVRMHYVITKGGEAPNIVPQFAEVWYYLRAHNPKILEDVLKRVQKIAEGAAMMTETRMEMVFNAASTNMLNNHTLADLQYENMQVVGAIQFSAEEIDFAEKVNAAFPPETIDALSKSYHIPLSGLREKPLLGENFPSVDEGEVMMFSTDVGDLSWKVPLSILMTTCFPTCASLHTWAAAAAAGTSIGRKGMLHAAKIMALTAMDLYQDAGKMKQVRAEFEKAVAEQPYRCPIPEDVHPPSYPNPLRGK